MREKSSGMAPGLANAPGQHKICKYPTSGAYKAGKCPAEVQGVGGGGCWAQLELTDTLALIICNVGLPKLQENVIIPIKVCLV